jgi:hypothetical protein
MIMVQAAHGAINGGRAEVGLMGLQCIQLALAELAGFDDLAAEIKVTDADREAVQWYQKLTHEALLEMVRGEQANG